MRWWLVVLALAGFPPAAWAQVEPPRAPLVFRVTGEAQAFPEKAILRFTIVGEGETPTKAQEKLDATEEAVVAVLEGQGIKRSQMQTQRFSVNPLQAKVDLRSAAGLTPLGYKVERDYGVTLAVDPQSLAKLVSLAELVLQQGARPTPASQRDSGYSEAKVPLLFEFQLTDSHALVEQALQDALEQARKLADQAAQKMGKPTAGALVGVNMTASDYGADAYGGHRPANGSVTMSSWEPVKAKVSAEVMFKTE